MRLALLCLFCGLPALGHTVVATLPADRPCRTRLATSAALSGLTAVSGFSAFAIDRNLDNSVSALTIVLLISLPETALLEPCSFDDDVSAAHFAEFTMGLSLAANAAMFAGARTGPARAAIGLSAAVPLGLLLGHWFAGDLAATGPLDLALRF
jgi:hypothetical protein